jgi:hypothetical protein
MQRHAKRSKKNILFHRSGRLLNLLLFRTLEDPPHGEIEARGRTRILQDSPTIAQGHANHEHLDNVQRHSMHAIQSSSHPTTGISASCFRCRALVYRRIPWQNYFRVQRQMCTVPSVICLPTVWHMSTNCQHASCHRHDASRLYHGYAQYNGAHTPALPRLSRRCGIAN